MNVLSTEFWSGRRVLVTGHTGFKGAWLCLMLHALGAEVSGFSLPSVHSLAHDLLGVSKRLRRSYPSDIREPGKVEEIVRETRPEVVFHLAAQSLVGEGYRDPGGTFAMARPSAPGGLAGQAGRCPGHGCRHQTPAP